MATIEEIEEKLNVGINLANDIQNFVTEQDRIARAEERERCIKAAIRAFCDKCTLYQVCKYKCPQLTRVVNAIKEGGEV